VGREVVVEWGRACYTGQDVAYTFRPRSLPVPAILACIITPIWDQFHALLPDREVRHPLGCHRPRVADRVVFDKLVQVLVFGCAYWRIADPTCSATTLRRRRDEWIDAGIMARLQALVLDAYDQMIGLQLNDIVVDSCITKAPCGGELAGRSPVDRGKQGLKRSTVVDAQGIPLGTIAAPANRHDSPLLDPTLDALGGLGPLPLAMTVHLDRGYDSDLTRSRLAARGLHHEIAAKGQPAPIAASQRWPVERTNAWTNAHKKLVWCTERRARVIAFWVTFSAVIITVGRLVREGWTRYRWDGRPIRKP
jgi:transposase